MLEGEQVIVTPTGEEFRLTPGSRLFIPPETMHQHTNPGATAVCFLGIFLRPPAYAKPYEHVPSQGTAGTDKIRAPLLKGGFPKHIVRRTEPFCSENWIPLPGMKAIHA